MTEDNRITQIREVVARHRANVSKHAEPDELDVLVGVDPNDPLQRYANLLVHLSAILDRSPSAPRVFLPGDVVPAGLWIIYRTPTGMAMAAGDEDWTAMDGAVVELTTPPLAEWEAAVDRAKAEREENRDG